MNKKALLAEFIATFALTFIGVGAIVSDYLTGGKVGLLGIAFAHGVTLCIMITAIAAISGGHVNPAVTVAIFLAKKIDSLNAVGYIIAQCLGSILAAFVIKSCVPAAALTAVQMGTPALAPDISQSMGFLTEVILTFFLVFAVFGTAVDKRAPKLGGLLIGLTVAVDILMGGPITGAAMNPARYLGPALMGGGLDNMWLYWAGPLTGGALASIIYSNFLLEK